jgi:hypothetical protein
MLNRVEETVIQASAPEVAAYFITGTGRCGTMLLARALALGTNTHCNHEHSVQTLTMKDAFYTGDYSRLHAESLRTLGELIREHGASARSYGECSSHVFPIVSELARQLGSRVRLALIVRRPDTFVGSALARGFFDPSHPKPCEHVRPSPQTDVGARWLELRPLEKNLWYWNLVNSRVLDAFAKLPAEQTTIIRMEDLGIEEVRRLFGFFGLTGFDEKEAELRSLLDVRVNASPGTGDDRSLNPWSQEIAVPDITSWSTADRDALARWAGPLARRLYPQWMSQQFGPQSAADRRLVR